MTTDTTRQAALAMDAATFRSLGHQLVDQLADCLAAVPSGPVTPAEAPSTVRAALDLAGSLPESGTDPGRLLADTTKLLFDHSLFNGHPRFFGYITSSPAPIGMLGDLLASAVNANCGSFILAPAATEIESQTVRWIAELIGYPAGCGGLLVSGGNMANMVCFLAARSAGKAGRAGGAGGAADADARGVERHRQRLDSLDSNRRAPPHGRLGAASAARCRSRRR